MLMFLLSPRISYSADPISVLLAAPGSVKVIAEYTGLVESLESKVDRLLDAELKTAVSLLEQAQANPKQSDSLVHDARVSFTRAAAIYSDDKTEAGRRKRAMAFLGLWACCKASRDKVNAKKSLIKIQKLPSAPSRVLIVKYYASKEIKSFVPTASNLLKVPKADGLFLGLFGSRVYRITMQQLQGGPSEKDLRRFSKDYDQLLQIKAAVAQKLKKK
jgi:hypothetical protein